MTKREYKIFEAALCGLRYDRLDFMDIIGILKEVMKYNEKKWEKELTDRPVG